VVTITGEQLQKASGFVRAQARRAPVVVIYHGRPELVILSVKDYALLHRNREVACGLADMPAAMMERIAHSRMDDARADLDVLMDD